MNNFVNGITLGSGNSFNPAIRFTDKPGTGIYSIGQDDLGFSVNTRVIYSCSFDGLIIRSDLFIPKNSTEGAYLISDSNGKAGWVKAPVQSGVISWNSIYNNLNETSDTITVNTDKRATLGSVIFSLETPHKIANNTFHIRNKTTSSFDIYSTQPIHTIIANKDADAISIIRLTNNCIGICYYDVEDDRIYYQYSYDEAGIEWSAPIMIDDSSAVSIVSMCLVNGYPAIGYIYNEGVNDEWRYVRANNLLGSVWGVPTTLATSSTGINFLPISIRLILLNGNPSYFYNDEHGRAKMIYSNDINGTSWAPPINISNLTNHQILNVKIVNGNPAILSKMNTTGILYFVRAVDDTGTTWPSAATQLYKNQNQNILVNAGQSSCDMGFIDEKLCIAAMEQKTNDLYLAYADDINGSSWRSFNIIYDGQTTSGYPRFIYNNGKSYLLMNKFIGDPSTKCLITFNSINSYTINENFLPVFNKYGDHRSISNVNDNNSIILITSEKKISLLRFYDDGFKINWISHNS